MSIDERENKKAEAKIFLNGNINGNEFQDPITFSLSNLKPGKFDQEYYRWDNLIHIEILCYIGDFLFKEEFLWEKSRKDVKEIKEFALTILMENEELNKTVNLTYEFLEFASEFITSKILHELKFYENFDPYKNLKNMFFEKGYGVGINAHLINIDIDLNLEKTTYKDHFIWDIINPENIPEMFSAQIVSEMNLPLEVINTISLIIRKQIKEYVFKIFKSLTALYPNLNNIKNDVFLNSLIKDINSLKSFLNSIKQNIHTTKYRLPIQNNPNLSKQGPLQKVRRGRGGRYKNEFKNSFLLKEINHNNNSSNNNNLNSNLQFSNEINNNTDFSDNFEVENISKSNRKELNSDFQKELKECKINSRRKSSKNGIVSSDLNLSLNEDGHKIDDSKKLTNYMSSNFNYNKRSRGRKKLIKNEENSKFCFEISSLYENNSNFNITNEHIVLIDHKNIVILKDLLEKHHGSIDRFVIEKNRLDNDVVAYFL